MEPLVYLEYLGILKSFLGSAFSTCLATIIESKFHDIFQQLAVHCFHKSGLVLQPTGRLLDLSKRHSTPEAAGGVWKVACLVWNVQRQFRESLAGPPPLVANPQRTCVKAKPRSCQIQNIELTGLSRANCGLRNSRKVQPAFRPPAGLPWVSSAGFFVKSGCRSRAAA